MSIRAALLAALDLCDDLPPYSSMTARDNALSIHVPDPGARRDLATEIGADSGALKLGWGYVDHYVVQNGLTINLHGKPDAEDWRRYREDQETAARAKAAAVKAGA